MFIFNKSIILGVRNAIRSPLLLFRTFLYIFLIQIQEVFFIANVAVLHSFYKYGSFITSCVPFECYYYLILLFQLLLNLSNFFMKFSILFCFCILFFNYFYRLNSCILVFISTYLIFLEFGPCLPISLYWFSRYFVLCCISYQECGEMVSSLLVQYLANKAELPALKYVNTQKTLFVFRFNLPDPDPTNRIWSVCRF